MKPQCGLSQITAPLWLRDEQSRGIWDRSLTGPWSEGPLSDCTFLQVTEGAFGFWQPEPRTLCPVLSVGGPFSLFL